MGVGLRFWQHEHPQIAEILSGRGQFESIEAAARRLRFRSNHILVVHSVATTAVQQLKPTQKTMVREKRTSRAVYGICNQISRESTLLAFIVVSARSGEPTNHHNPFLRLQISRRVICIPINITSIIERAVARAQALLHEPT